MQLEKQLKEKKGPRIGIGKDDSCIEPCYSKGVEPRVPDDYLPADSDLSQDAATNAADHV